MEKREQEAAVERFYDCHGQAVFRLALSIVKDARAAEDIVQSVFLKVTIKAAVLDRIRHPRAWVSVVTRNLAFNALRDGKWEMAADWPEVADAEHMEDRVEYRETTEAILACLDCRERLLFTMHYVDGYAYNDMAVVTGMQPGAIRVACHRAKKKLKAALGSAGKPITKKEENAI